MERRDSNPQYLSPLKASRVIKAKLYLKKAKSQRMFHMLIWMPRLSRKQSRNRQRSRAISGKMTLKYLRQFKLRLLRTNTNNFQMKNTITVKKGQPAAIKPKIRRSIRKKTRRSSKSLRRSSLRRQTHVMTSWMRQRSSLE